MKLRTPRTEIPEETYWRGMLKLFHPLMFAPIMMLVTIGTFLADEVNLQAYLLELIAVFFAVLSAYHLDEYMEKTTAPAVPKLHNKIICIISIYIALAIGLFFITRNSLLWMPTIIALIGIMLYNTDVKHFKNRVVYSLSWAGCPVFGSYMLQTGGWPNPIVIVFTILGMVFAAEYYYKWSFKTCGRSSVCPKYNPDRPCHGPFGLIKCGDRLQMPKEISDSMKILQKLELIILFCLMVGVMLW